MPAPCDWLPAGAAPTAIAVPRTAAAVGAAAAAIILLRRRREQWGRVESRLLSPCSDRIAGRWRGYCQLRTEPEVPIKPVPAWCVSSDMLNKHLRRYARARASRRSWSAR